MKSARLASPRAVAQFFPRRGCLGLFAPGVILGLLPLRSAGELPLHFADIVEAGLLCRSEWGSSFWQDYFSEHLKIPLRDWGEARWWPAPPEIALGGMKPSELFINIEWVPHEPPNYPWGNDRDWQKGHEDRALMIGALIPLPLEQVKPTIERTFNIRFDAHLGPFGLRYINDSLSTLQPTVNGQTKWFCAKWNLGNRRGDRPVDPPPGYYF